MGYEPNWDEWDNLHLILDERLSGFLRFFKNFVMDGYQLSDPMLGLWVSVGQMGLNVAYCNGYELKQTNAVLAALADASTNYIYLHFTKTVDPGGGYSAIALDITVNQTGVDPGDAIKLGEVDTLAGVITAIRTENNKFKIHTSQLDEDIDGNLYRINRLTLQRGTVFPVTPAPIQSELFWRTDLLQLYVYDGVAWQPLTPGAPPGAVIFTASPLAPPILTGEMVYVGPTPPSVPLNVTQAIALAMATAEVVGAAMGPVMPGFPGSFATWHGNPCTAYYEAVAPVIPPVPGRKVWLSKFTPGAVTTLAPPNPCARKVLGVIADNSVFAWPANPYLTVLWAPEPTVWVP